MIAVDAPVLIDLLAGADAQADVAEHVLRDALSKGLVVYCDVVLAEVVAVFGDDVVDVLESMGMRHLPTELRTAIRAGAMQRRFNQRSLADASTPPPLQRSVSDFLIGAHALMQCSGLITRDNRFFRDYFKGLKIITATPTPMLSSST